MREIKRETNPGWVDQVTRHRPPQHYLDAALEAAESAAAHAPKLSRRTLGRRLLLPASEIAAANEIIEQLRAAGAGASRVETGQAVDAAAEAQTVAASAEEAMALDQLLAQEATADAETRAEPEPEGMPRQRAHARAASSNSSTGSKRDRR